MPFFLSLTHTHTHAEACTPFLTCAMMPQQAQHQLDQQASAARQKHKLMQQLLSSHRGQSVLYPPWAVVFVHRDCLRAYLYQSIWTRGWDRGEENGGEERKGERKRREDWRRERPSVLSVGELVKVVFVFNIEAWQGHHGSAWVNRSPSPLEQFRRFRMNISYERWLASRPHAHTCICAHAHNWCSLHKGNYILFPIWWPCINDIMSVGYKQAQVSAALHWKAQNPHIHKGSQTQHKALTKQQ